MRKRIRPGSLIIALLLLLFSSGAALAGSNTRAGITIDFNYTGSGDDGENTVTGIGPDQVLRIDVYAHDVAALKCFEFDMIFDTSAIGNVSVIPTGGVTLESNILDGWTTPVGQVSGNNISVANANDTTSDGANGDGLLAEISMRTKSSFTTSTEALFRITSVVYVDTGGVNDHILNLNTYHIDGAINPTDTTPPDAITDLAATPSGADSTITLSWTDPGGAVTCLFKYSANPILTEADWEDAILLANADFQGGTTPTPSAGTATVIGLPEGDYHFVMKTMDSTPNVSGLSNDAPTIPGYMVSGTVGLADNPSDSSGSEVCIGSFCDSTDSHGAYSISNVSSGTYDIIATHSGYYPDTVSITISSDTTVNFSLNPIAYTVSGTVGLTDNPSDSSGSVVCLDSRCDTTDIHGAYSISDVEGGTYDIIATHSGYYPDTVSVTISSDTTVNFSLNPIAYTVSGTVGLADNPSDSSGSQVCIGSFCDSTDIHGAYSISDVEGGTYDIIATHSGYDPDTVSMTISSDTTVNFSLTEIIYDVGVARIVAPPDTTYPGVDYIPQAWVRNYGDLTVSFDVTCEIDSYLDTTTVVDLNADDSTLVSFDEWKVASPESLTFHMTVTTLLANDSDPSNNSLVKTIFYTKVEDSWIRSQLPQAYSLSQNYPNPFNPLTQIEYSIPHREWVKLEVYNTLGEKVTTLVDRLQEPGYYRIGWDAGDLRSGVYFCRMETGSFTFTRRMVLLK